LGGTYDLVGIHRPPRRDEDPNVRFVGLDVSDDESVIGAMQQLDALGIHDIAAVVHLAAFYDFSGEENPLYDQVTVQGTRRLLDGLRASFEVESFIFSSTMLVHKPCKPGEKIDEEWPLQPAWPYPKSKMQTEQVIAEHRGDMPAVILRISGVYDDVCDSIPLSQQIRRIYEKNLTSYFWPGDTNVGQSFLHLEDLAAALECTIERRHDLGDECVLLLGEEEVVPYDELQDEIGRLVHGDEWPTLQIPKPVAKAGAWVRDALPGKDPFIQPWMVDIADAHYDLDISRARRTLRWKPERSLRETLPKMVQALKQDPKAWYERHRLGEPPEPST
jgi:nucleoside-diphosphate-sugar epimerase